MVVRLSALRTDRLYPQEIHLVLNSVPIDMLLSAVSFLVVAQSSSEVPEGLMNNPVYKVGQKQVYSIYITVYLLLVHPVCV